MKKLIFIYLCSWTLIVYNFACTNQHFEKEKAQQTTLQKESLERNFYLRSESSMAGTAKDFIVSALPVVIAFHFNGNPLAVQRAIHQAHLLTAPAEYLFLVCRNLRI
jgi:hypothetical protein